LHDEARRHLEDFKAWLVAAGLSDMTIERHLNNAYFFLFLYLADHLHVDAAQGIAHVGDYLGSYFIDEMVWVKSTPANMRATAVSIKKLYRSMEASGFVTTDDLDRMIQEVEDGLPAWCAACGDNKEPRGLGPLAALW